MDTYKATNTLNGKFYIGSTTNFEERKKAHLTSKDNYPFQNALRANPDAFEWEVWSDSSDGRELEQALLDVWYGKEQCYNLNPTASAPPVLVGERNPRFGMAREDNPLYGKIWWVKLDGSEERLSTEQPEGDWVKGRKKSSDSCRKKQSEAHIGLLWWTNSKGKSVRQRECPGPGWVNSMGKEVNKGDKNPAFGKKWWVSPSGETILSITRPGPDWQNGRVYKFELGV